jgi:acyl carrier protein
MTVSRANWRGLVQRKRPVRQGVAEGKLVMSIENQIKAYILENFLFSDNGYELAEDASFLEEGIVDSTGVLELVMFVEETYDIAVEDEEIVPENFDSVSQLAAYIGRKMG